MSKAQHVTMTAMYIATVSLQDGTGTIHHASQAQIMSANVLSVQIQDGTTEHAMRTATHMITLQIANQTIHVIGVLNARTINIRGI